MGDGPVVERVLDKLQEYLYDNLPPDEDFIIQLQNSGTINKDTARKLRALARNGDRSCIRDLITHLQEHGEEATLDKFCTSLEKYGKKGRPRMVTVAAKIREELKALGSPPSQATLPSQLAPPTQPTLPSLYQHREVRDERDFGGEVNEPGPSGSKRSQLHSDDQYSQPKRPYSTTKDPTAPRAGMDEKIGSCIDILGKPAYKKGLINNMATLGLVLGIEEETQAILNRNGTIDAQLLEILRRYINETSPTWRNFCTALEKNTLFKDVREKIEADHNSKQRPAVGVGDEPGALKNVRFAIITANENEWESAKFFMGIGKCITKGHLKDYLTENFSDLFEADPDKITVEFVKSIDTYYLVRVGGVLGVLTECFKMGSLGPGESFDTVKKLRDTASEKLEAVFLVGCCGCASQETDVLGTVLVADKIYPYEGGEFNEEGYTQQHEPITMAEDWVYRLEFRNNETAKISEALKVQKLSRAPFFSGCKMKDKNQAEKLQKKINARFLGFEMEGVGAYLPVKNFKASKTDILVVKGVSDQGDRCKNEPASITFFSKKVQEVDEDTRQQMCTMMSLMVVFRAIKAKWGEN